MTDDVEVNGNTDEPQVNVELEKEARVFGWVPKEEFRGSDDQWVDADAFVKRGKEINPILRKNNEIDGIKASVEEFKAFQKEGFERKQAALLLEIAELKVEKKTAIAQGDGDRVVDIDDRIDAIKEEQREAKVEVKQPEVAPTPQRDPEVDAWLGRNPWFDTDDEMTDVTNGLGKSLRKQFPTLTGREFLDKLDERVAQYFPKVAGNKARGSAVDSTGNVRSGATGKKSYENLPADAKDACDKFVKQGLFKTKQDYVDMYDWS